MGLSMLASCLKKDLWNVRYSMGDRSLNKVRLINKGVGLKLRAVLLTFDVNES